MRLAFYTYSYTDRLELPIEECFARIAAAGYTGVDESSTFGKAINSGSVSRQRRMQIRQAAARHQLRVEAVVTHAELTGSLHEDEPLDLCASIDLAAELGGDVVTFHLGGAVPGVPERTLWRKVAGVIREAAGHGDARHVKLAIDLGPWPTWIVRDEEGLSRLFEEVGSETFGVNYDPSYLAIQGIDPVRFAARFGPRIVHAHLKDHLGQYPKWEHKIPGQGELRYVPILEALDRAKFTGALAVECFTDMKFEEACDVGYRTLHEAFMRAKAPLETRAS